LPHVPLRQADHDGHGRGRAARPRRDDAHPRPARGAGDAARPALPGRARAGDRRDGLLLGRRAGLLAGPGIFTTAVGYAGGLTPNPTYEEVCSGRTGHTEAVLVAFDPAQTSYDDILRLFWENHDPTQGMRQGNDTGTQYRSAVYWTSEAQRDAAEASRAMFQQELSRAGYRETTTELAEAGPFYYAEPYHQQYLAKNPNGYCGLGGTGIACPVRRADALRTE